MFTVMSITWFLDVDKVKNGHLPRVVFSTDLPLMTTNVTLRKIVDNNISQTAYFKVSVSPYM